MLVIKKTKKEDILKLSKIYVRAYDRLEFGEKWSIKNAKKLLNFYFSQKTFIGVIAILDKKIVGGG
ncbi:MAG: hypothetical protein V1910_02340 [bacterium]